MRLWQRANVKGLTIDRWTNKSWHHPQSYSFSSSVICGRYKLVVMDFFLTFKIFHIHRNLWNTEEKCKKIKIRRGGAVTPQLTDPETTDTSTKRQSTNCTQSFAATRNDRLHERLNYLMVKMRREGQGWRANGRKEGKEADKERGDTGGVSGNCTRRRVKHGGEKKKRRVSRPEEL